MKKLMMMIALAGVVSFATAQDGKDAKKETAKSCCSKDAKSASSSDKKSCCQKPAAGEKKACCKDGDKAKAATTKTK